MTEQVDREFYEGQEVDPEDQLQPGDTLDDRGVEDVLDEGYSPPDREPRHLTESTHNLDEWLAQEEPDTDPYARDRGTPDARAGRLVSPDEGLTADTEKDEVARDVGIDGAGSSAEEAAMHVIDGEAGEDEDWV